MAATRAVSDRAASTRTIPAGTDTKKAASCMRPRHVGVSEACGSVIGRSRLRVGRWETARSVLRGFGRRKRPGDDLVSQPRGALRVGAIVQALGDLVVDRRQPLQVPGAALPRHLDAGLDEGPAHPLSPPGLEY